MDSLRFPESLPGIHRSQCCFRGPWGRAGPPGPSGSDPELVLMAVHGAGRSSVGAEEKAGGCRGKLHAPWGLGPQRRPWQGVVRPAHGGWGPWSLHCARRAPARGLCAATASARGSLPPRQPASSHCSAPPRPPRPLHPAPHAPGPPGECASPLHSGISEVILFRCYCVACRLPGPLPSKGVGARGGGFPFAERTMASVTRKAPTCPPVPWPGVPAPAPGVLPAAWTTCA